MKRILSSTGSVRFEPTGLYLDEITSKGASITQWLCSPLRILNVVRTDTGGEWGRQVEFVDLDGNRSRALVWMADAKGDCDIWWSALGARGFIITNEPRLKRVVGAFIRDAVGANRLTIARHVGWSRERDIFVMPSGSVIGHRAEPTTLVLKGFSEAILDDTPPVSLEAWQACVAEPCRGNSRLILALCAPFAAALLDPLAQKNVAFHLFGSSSIGKSTALRVATSVVGDPRQLIQSWNATSPGLELLLARRNDSIVMMDEIGEASDHLLKAMPYLFSGGKGKLKSNHVQTLNESISWRAIMVSTGEVSLSQALARKGQNSDAGHSVRFIDVPADACSGMGIFESLNGHSSPKEFSAALNQAVDRYYGVALAQYVEALIKSGLPELIAAAPEALRHHADAICPGNASAQVRRVADGFALLRLAGELAYYLKILPFEPPEVFAAVSACFEAWLDQRGTADDLEHDQFVEHVRLFCQLHGRSSFDSWNPDCRLLQLREGVGYVCEDPLHEKAGYYVYPETSRARCARAWTTGALRACCCGGAYSMETSTAGHRFSFTYRDWAPSGCITCRST